MKIENILKLKVSWTERVQNGTHFDPVLSRLHICVQKVHTFFSQKKSNQKKWPFFGKSIL